MDLKVDEIGKVSFLVEWGVYCLEVKVLNEVVSSVCFWVGYSWQDNSDGSGVVWFDCVMLKLDKVSYCFGDIIKLYIVVLMVGKGYVMVEFSEGLLWW